MTPDNGDYPTTIPELRKLVTKQDVSLFKMGLQRDELLEVIEQLLTGFVTAGNYPNFEQSPDKFVELATIETLARAAITRARG